MSAISVGEHCSNCHRTEQQCALHWPCCLDCGHWRNLDGKGNSEPREPSHSERLRIAERALGTPPADVHIDEPEPDPLGPAAALSPYLTDPLLRELIPCRPSPKPGYDLGPTEQWRRVEARRLLWEMAQDNADAPADGQVAS